MRSYIKFSSVSDERIFIFLIFYFHIKTKVRLGYIDVLPAQSRFSFEF